MLKRQPSSTDRRRHTILVRSSKNSKANRIETGESAPSTTTATIWSAGLRAASAIRPPILDQAEILHREEVLMTAKISATAKAFTTLCQHLATPLKDAVIPWVLLGGGGGVIIPWVNLSVTGNGGPYQR
jgi:hypothetical protein